MLGELLERGDFLGEVRAQELFDLGHLERGRDLRRALLPLDAKAVEAECLRAGASVSSGMVLIAFDAPSA